ncbi:hypothetical protein, partial [Psychrobacter proteolyticus]|uniref:hypothetical protein n=1 Tax=Psychrobacter proteolyticus TaxID=147825 RepID=UPI00311F1366
IVCIRGLAMPQGRLEQAPQSAWQAPELDQDTGQCSESFSQAQGRCLSQTRPQQDATPAPGLHTNWSWL